MNITILGAGAMGSLFGGLLAEAGASVTLLDINQQHLDAIRRDGLRLETDSRSSTVTHLTAGRPEEASRVPDLLMLFTKTHQIAPALLSARHLLGPATWILTLQNGLGNVEAISAFVPRERILVGVTTIPADFLGPAHVASHGRGQIRMGHADRAALTDHPGHRPFNEGCMLCQTVALFNRAGLHAVADPNVWAAVWEKVAFNAAFNALCAVTGCTVEQIELVPSGPAMALAVVAEAIAVARASGVPADLERTQAMVLQSFQTHAGHQPSMLQDILAGRRTEIDSINGAIVRAAQAHNLPAPHTAMLWTLVSLIDARQARQSEERTKPVAIDLALHAMSS
ncbi:MAG: 2-dehydropantoate 2-reductase [Acidobacteriaceae bacterium]